MRQRRGLHKGRRRGAGAWQVAVGIACAGDGWGILRQWHRARRVGDADATVVAGVFQRLSREDDVGRLCFFQRFEGQRLFGKVVVDINDDAVAAPIFRRHGVDVRLGGIAQVDDDPQRGFVAKAGADAGNRAGVERQAGATAARSVGQVENDAWRPGEAELAEDGGAVKVENELGFIRQTVVAHVLQGYRQRLRAKAQTEEEHEQQFAPAVKHLYRGSQHGVSL